MWRGYYCYWPPHLEGPDDGVDDELEVLGGDAEEGGEAVLVDRLDEL